MTACVIGRHKIKCKETVRNKIVIGNRPLEKDTNFHYLRRDASFEKYHDAEIKFHVNVSHGQIGKMSKASEERIIKFDCATL